MKKFTSLFLLMFMFALSLFSCADTTAIKVGYMSGPTGMGMAKMIHDNLDSDEKYEFTNFENNTQGALAKLVAGEVDIVCVPTNLAAIYYNQNKNIQVLAVNCLNSLYVVTDKNTTLNSFEDLNGTTIYTCKSGTPKPIIEYVLRELGINATVSTSFEGTEIIEPKNIGQLVTAGKLPIAVMPEPLVTSSLLQIQKNGDKNIEYSVDLDLADAWNETNDTPVTMGCIVTTTDFAANNKNKIDNFLAEYEASINYISKTDNLDSASEFIVESAIIGALPAAKKSLANLGDSIAYLDGEEMKEALLAFYKALNLAAPDNSFFYE